MFRQTPGTLGSGRSTPCAIPKEYLRWLYKALEASSIAIFLYGRQGTLVEAMRFGGIIPDLPMTNDLRGADLQILLLAPETREKVAVMELRDSARSPSDPSGTFGYLVVYREAGISELKIQDLEELAIHLGDEVQVRRQIIAANRDQRARRSIEEIVQREQRAGTRIASVMRQLQIGSEASFVGFGVIQDQRFRLLYLKRPHDKGDAKYIVHEPRFPLSKPLRELCWSGAVTRLEGTVERVNAVKILGLRPHQAADMRFFVAAATSEGEALAAFILATFNRAPDQTDMQLLGLGNFVLDRLRGDIERLYAIMNGRMIVNPIFHGRATELTSNEIFVLMPFSENWSDQIWLELVRPICETQGFVAHRADDLYGPVFMENIWRGICRARVVIADLTNRNPNVFYELGIAHTIGKDVILITQNINDIPADLRHYRCITYQNSVGGYAPFERNLTNALRELAGIGA